MRAVMMNLLARMTHHWEGERKSEQEQKLQILRLRYAPLRTGLGAPSAPQNKKVAGSQDENFVGRVEKTDRVPRYPILALDQPCDEDLSQRTRVRRKDGARSFVGDSVSEKQVPD